MIKRWLDKNRGLIEIFYIVASVCSIIALIFSIITINEQHKNELKNFISDLENLDIELNNIITILDEINQTPKEILLRSTIDIEIPTQTVLESLSDGRITNTNVKYDIYSVYLQINQLNKRLNLLNDPNFYTADPNTYPQRRLYVTNEIYGLINRSFNDINRLKPNLNKLISCLKNQSKINNLC